jgi:small subunit ribosomal protein S8
MLTDPIADMLTRIRNAAAARHTSLEISYSREKEAILNIMKLNGFINNVVAEERAKGQYKVLNVTLAKKKIDPKRVSSPGHRVYITSEKIEAVKNGLGLMIISTSQGVLSGKDAKQKGLGGEYICEIR